MSQIQEKKYKTKKSTIFLSDGTLVPDLSEKALICGRHIKLAHLIDQSVTDPELKRKMLLMVDEVYDMGKRMDRKLMDYRKILGLPKGIARQQENQRLEESEEYL